MGLINIKATVLFKSKSNLFNTYYEQVEIQTRLETCSTAKAKTHISRYTRKLG